MHTRPAKTAYLSGPAVGVLGRVFMTLWAVSLAQLSLCCLSAPHVLCSGHEFKMPGIAARRHAAQVIRFEPIWDRPSKVFIGGSVDQNISIGDSASSDDAVVFDCGAHPDPAAALGDHLDAAHDALDQWCKIVLRHRDSPIVSRCSEPLGTSNAARLVSYCSAGVLS